MEKPKGPLIDEWIKKIQTIEYCAYVRTVAQSCPTLLWPHGLQPTRLFCPWSFLGKNTGVGCHFLLQGILTTQRSDPHLLHRQADSLPLSQLGSTQWDEYYSAIKMNERVPFAATRMDQEVIILSEVGKTNNIRCHFFVESKLWHKWTYLWNNHGHREQTWQLSKGRQGARRMDWESGVSRCQLLHIGWINNKVLLYSTGKYIQYPGINHTGKEY